MIEFVHLHCFQTHTDTRIEFGDGASVLIGETEAGKSTAIRALGWTLMDDPSGDFVQFGGKVVSVSVGIDGHVVTKTRRNGLTWYVLDDGEPFKGAAVPPSIQRIVNMTHVNWQFQFDPPFWLSDSGGEVSRQINSIVDMQSIDRVTARAATDSRTAITATQAAKLNAVAAITAADETPDSRNALRGLNRIFPLEESLTAASAAIFEYDHLAVAAVSVFDVAAESRRTVTALESVTSMGKVWRICTRTIEEFDAESKGVTPLWGCRKRGQLAREATAALDAQSRASDACIEAERRLGDFDRDVRSLMVVFDAKASADHRVETMTAEVDAARADAVSVGSLCGECGRPL